MNIYYEAAIWIGMALLAARVSIRIAVPVALVEIVVGAIFANIPGVKEHITQATFVTFLAGVGSILFRFLAGAEIDPVSLKRHSLATVMTPRTMATSPRLVLRVIRFSPFCGLTTPSCQRPVRVIMTSVMPWPFALTRSWRDLVWRSSGEPTPRRSHSGMHQLP
jgi:Kef-type K+ transport system membrane component KefB